MGVSAPNHECMKGNCYRNKNYSTENNLNFQDPLNTRKKTSKSIFASY